MNAPRLKFIPAPSVWASPLLENLYASLEAQRNAIPGWHDGDDETAEQAHALDAAMEACEELDIRLGNAGVTL